MTELHLINIYHSVIWLTLCNYIGFSYAVKSTNKSEESSSKLPYIPIRPITFSSYENHSVTVILLHDIGSVGHRWYPTAREIKRPFVKIVLPTSNQMILSANKKIMRSWFDVYASGKKQDTKGLAESTKYIHYLIDEDTQRGIWPERIFLGGFGQGGYLALHCALTYPKKLGGIILLSSHIPCDHEKFLKSVPRVQKNIPILQIHGKQDDSIKYEVAKKTAAILKKVSKNFKFKSYPKLEHAIIPEENEDMREFIYKNLNYDWTKDITTTTTAPIFDVTPFTVVRKKPKPAKTTKKKRIVIKKKKP